MQGQQMSWTPWAFSLVSHFEDKSFKIDCTDRKASVLTEGHANKPQLFVSELGLLQHS